MSDSLEVISTWLLVADVSVEGGVSSSACQILALSKGDVLAFGVLETLGETEVNNVDVILRLLCGADQEVVWLDVTVNDAFFMNFLNSLDLNLA